MTILSKVVAFLNTSKPEEARAFFGDKLGFPFLGDDGNALVFDVNGTKLRVTKAAAFTPAHGTVLGWEVDDVAVGGERISGIHDQQFIEMPELGLDWGETFDACDEVTDTSYQWGQANYVRLDPFREPAHVMTVKYRR